MHQFSVQARLQHGNNHTHSHHGRRQFSTSDQMTMDLEPFQRIEMVIKMLCRVLVHLIGNPRERHGLVGDIPGKKGVEILCV